MPAGRILDRLYFQGMRAIATLSYKCACANCVSSFGCVGIQARGLAENDRRPPQSRARRPELNSGESCHDSARVRG